MSLTRLGTGWDWAVYDIGTLDWWEPSGKVLKQILLSKLLVLISKQIFSGASSKLFLSGPGLFGTETGKYALPINVYHKDRGIYLFWCSIIALFLKKAIHISISISLEKSLGR